MAVEASWAVWAPLSWEAELPNSTWDSTSDWGREGVEVRVITGLAAVPAIFTDAVRLGPSQVADRSSRICSGALARVIEPRSSKSKRLPANS